jgi:hypothetical protein
MSRYVLTILSPTGEEKRFESSTPFMPIAKGEVVSFNLFQDADGLNLPLRVVEVEHMLWQEPGSVEPAQMVSITTERYRLD